MPKNQVQFQKGLSLHDFMDEYGTEEQCEKSVFQAKWGNGFTCTECGHHGYCELKTRKRVYQCNRCKHQTKLLSNTLFANTRMPLRKWFLAIYLLTQSKNSISALELKRQLGCSYDAAYKLKHKLMQAMRESDDKHKISGLIQVDDAFWGGENRGGKRGRGSENKTPFVAAVALNEHGNPTYMKLGVLETFDQDNVSKWAMRNMKDGSMVISDGLPAFRAFESQAYTHAAFKTSGNLDLLVHKAFKWVNTVLGNVKTALLGSCHAIRRKHMPRYFAEFCYRFNNRFNLASMVPSLIAKAVNTPPMPYKLLKLDDTKW